jgi:hypothetical protein
LQCSNAKAGYVERQAFLERVGQRQDEEWLAKERERVQREALLAPQR